jgi:hypothetical protein
MQMDPSLQPLIDYIKSHKAHGTHEDKIWVDLLNANWPYDHIQRAFDIVDGPKDVQPAQPLPVVGQNPAAQQPLNSLYSPPASQVSAQPIAQTYATQASPALNPITNTTTTVESSTTDGSHTSSSVPADSRQKFTVRAAVKDVYRGIKVNWQTFLACTGIMLAISFVLLVISTLIIGAILHATGGSAIGLLTGNVFVLIGLYLLVLVITSALSTVMVSLIALSLRDGLDGHRGNIMPTTKAALRATVRLMLTNALVAVVTVGPYLLVSLIGLGIVFGVSSHGLGGRSANIGILVFSILFMVAAAVWIICAMLRFALASYVALFEPGLPIPQTLGRSKHLLVKGGQWFLIKGFFSVLVVAIIIALITGFSFKGTNVAGNIIFTIFSYVINFITYGVLYALYRNRVAVKG